MMEPLEREIVSDLDDKTDDRAAAGRRSPLYVRILIGLTVGAGAGGIARLALGAEAPALLWTVAQIAEPLGQLFLRLLLMTVVPLVFTSLVVGVAGMGDIRRLGRVGLRSLAYTVVISVISVVIGFAVANTIRPGTRIDPGTRQALMARFSPEASRQVQARTESTVAPLMSFVQAIVPINPLESAARSTPDMIAVMFFAMMFGISLTLLKREVAEPVVAVMSGVFEAVTKLIDIVLKLAPIGVAALMFTMTARFGFGFLAGLAWFVGTVLLGLSIHMFVVYPLALKLFAHVSPIEFFRRTKMVALTAFSTSSSNATLPTALRVSEVNLHVPREIGTFVLTIGATANQNGTALYEGVTVLFLAQLAGFELSMGQQLTVLYLCILGGIGTAGVPSGSIPFVVAVLNTVGIDPSLIAIIIGVDRILDMCRTTLNVVGDLTAAVYVARSEGAPLWMRTAART